MPDWLFLVLVGLLGLVFGSFANVVIWRYPRGQSLSHPPSACPACGTPIKWYDNVPVVAWIALRAHCRACGEGVSARYPAVELLSAALWVTAAVVWGQSARTIVAIVLFYLLLILSFIDIDTMRLPNPLVGLMAVLGSGAVLVAQFTAVDAAPLTPVLSGSLSSPILAAVVGVVLGGGVSLALAAGYAAVRKAEGFGMGDVKLLAAMGPFLGPYTLLVLFLGSLLGAVWGIAAASGKGGSLRSKIPFGPFLALAAVLVSLFGPAAWGWYIALVTGS